MIAVTLTGLNSARGHAPQLASKSLTSARTTYARVAKRALALGCLLCVSPVGAWQDHASLLWPLVSANPALMQPSLRVESLDSFVREEAAGLELLLEEHEAWSRRAFREYAPRPDELAFRADASDLTRAFVEAIRVNPEHRFALYRAQIAEDDGRGTLRWSSLSFLPLGEVESTLRFVALRPHQNVSPAHVVASGNDEPDFGMDIGLFADNGTEFGARYGFGPQPFGDPKLAYSSQAPFHMGFYYLDWLTRTVQPDLLRTHLRWRIALYSSLAEFAFATGHPYWGWRMGGWALHYIGDLSQPYHAMPLPGVSTLEALLLVAKGETDAAIQLVSNRHAVIESYQYERVQSALRGDADTQSLLQAIAQAENVPNWSLELLVDSFARASSDAGAELDAALEARVPAQFVSDPSFAWVGSGYESEIVELIRQSHGASGVEAMDAVLDPQMRRFSLFANTWIDWLMTKQLSSGRQKTN